MPGPASDPTILLAVLDHRIAKAQRARAAISGHGGSAFGTPEDVVTLNLEEAIALVARVREGEREAAKFDAETQSARKAATRHAGFGAGARAQRDADSAWLLSFGEQGAAIALGGHEDGTVEWGQPGKVLADRPLVALPLAASTGEGA